MKKKTYERPCISKATLEVEGSFMSASVFEPQKSGEGVTIKGHEISDEIGFSEPSEFDTNTWD